MIQKVIYGDCLEAMRALESNSIHCCVTSPPYWGLRDYGIDGQLGLEKTPQEYVEKLVVIFREVKRVLRNDGTLWLNLGDTYTTGSGSYGTKSNKQRSNMGTMIAPRVRVTGLKPKDLVGIPWHVTFALQADGWYLRQDIIWHKPNPMPESVRDRCTKAHEYIFLLSKNERYYYDQEAIKEASVYSGPQKSRPRGSFQGKGAASPGLEPFRAVTATRNKRSVWTVTTKPLKEAHFATFPPDLIRPCILAGCPKGGTILDPFFGAGTVGVVAKEEGCGYIGIELNPGYCGIARKRIDAIPERLI